MSKPEELSVPTKGRNPDQAHFSVSEDEINMDLL